MLSHRIITALILASICGGILFYAPPQLFAASAWLLCMIAIYEACKMYKFTMFQITATLILLQLRLVFLWSTMMLAKLSVSSA